MEYHNPTLRVLRILELIDAHSGVHQGVYKGA